MGRPSKAEKAAKASKVVLEILTDKAGRGSKTSYVQTCAILGWLEQEPGNNLRLITGDATSSLTGVVAGAKLKKKDAYEALALWVNQNCGTNWTTGNAESRWASYIKLYKETNRRREV